MSNLSDIYNLIQELSWYFGDQGFDGECCGNLSLVEFMALKKVHDKSDIGVQEIGNALNITKSGASKIIDRIENKGYISRVQCTVDGRACCIRITDQGIEAITQIVNRYTGYVGSALASFEPDEVNNVRSVLARLVNSIRERGFIKL